jgi:hypothetical protein
VYFGSFPEIRHPTIPKENGMDRNAPSVSIGDFPHDTQKAGFRPTIVVSDPKKLVSPTSLLINHSLLSFGCCNFLFTKHNNYFIIGMRTPSFF